MSYKPYNSAKKVKDASRPPWADWRGSKAGRIIRFIEEHCVVPKGVGAGSLVSLQPFQKEALEALFADGVRTGEFSVGRGNGKSTLMAATALAHLMIEPYSPQVPLVAVTLRQVEKATFNVAVSMAKRSPEIADRVNVYNAVGNKAIRSPWNDGDLFPISSDIDGLQGLDFSLGLIDEYGFVTVESWEALKLAGGKRPESLLVGLGTTGERGSAHHRLHQLDVEGVDIPGHRRIVYSAPDGCDIRDRDAWRAANPGLGTILSEDVLIADAESSPESAYRAFRLNQWVDMVGKESWLGPNAIELWSGLADPGYEWDDGRPCFAGVDVSLKHDTTAVVAVQERPDGRWHARSMIWRSDGRAVDQQDVQQYVRSLPNLAGVAYDPRFWELAAQQLSDEGILCIEVPQTQHRMVPAIGMAYRMITGGQLTHDGAPDFASQVANAVPRHGESGFTLSKIKSDLKIDAAIALALALSISVAPPPEPALSTTEAQLW